MAITNCTLANATGGTDVVFANVGGSAIGSDVAEFFITANPGFTVRAANFVNNTGSQSWLTSITLTDTDTNLTSLSNYSSNGDVLFPHATTANTVKVTVTLNTSFTMPTSDTTLIFDIDDAAGENGGAQQGSRIELNVDAIYDPKNYISLEVTRVPDGKVEDKLVNFLKQLMKWPQLNLYMTKVKAENSAARTATSWLCKCT